MASGTRTSRRYTFCCHGQPILLITSAGGHNGHVHGRIHFLSGSAGEAWRHRSRSRLVAIIVIAAPAFAALAAVTNELWAACSTRGPLEDTITSGRVIGNSWSIVRADSPPFRRQLVGSSVMDALLAMGCVLLRIGRSTPRKAPVPPATTASSCSAPAGEPGGMSPPPHPYRCDGADRFPPGAFRRKPLPVSRASVPPHESNIAEAQLSCQSPADRAARAEDRHFLHIDKIRGK